MTQLTIDTEQLEQLIVQRLPTLIQQSPKIQEVVLELARQNFAERQETGDRFHQILEELRRDREEQRLKWKEYLQEQNRIREEQNQKWEQQNQKWEQQNQKWDEQNQKWEQQSQKWDEQSQKWDEQNRKWQEQQEEQNRKWQEQQEEQNRKWQEQQEEQNRKWQEQQEEQNRKWEEQNRKWEEQNQKWREQNEKQDRKWEEQNRRWQEQNEKQDRKWEEQNRKWEDTKREFDKVHESIMAMAKKLDRSISAIGARWGLKSERAFRHALVGILEESFGIQVLNITDYDDEGVVFGRPDQIELDIIIKNGLLIICELKSSISRSDVYMFERKVRFYEKRHQRQANRILIISPMVEAKARHIADNLGIEVFDDALDVDSL